MDQTPLDIFIMAVELTLTLLVLGFIGTMITLGTQMTKSYQKEVDIANTMQEYASFSKYDDTSLSGSDAVEAIHMYASSDLTVTIKSSGSTRNFTDGNVTDCFSREESVGLHSSVRAGSGLERKIIIVIFVLILLDM